jgi:hypothetical protein
MRAKRALTTPLESIGICFEGLVPSAICSCSKDGTPNVTYLSIVHRIDDHHVGLTFQFFNKTRRNLQENPRAQVIVASPETGCQYRLNLVYERTETEGSLFDRVKTRLDAVASQTGMSHVFKLRGVDVYQVLECRPVSSNLGAEVAPADHMAELDALTERLAACCDLDSLLDTAMHALSSLFGYDHLFLMVPDEDGKRLYTLASHGFETSGVGSEVLVGEGIVGVAAERRMTVRSTSMVRDVVYSRAVRSGVEHRGKRGQLEQEIPLPGLTSAQSQLVVPLLAQNELLGVLCLQSPVAGRFLASDERLMQIAARHLASRMALLQIAAAQATPDKPGPLSAASRTPLQSARQAVIKHFLSDDTVFIDDLYLIKGIAGRIFWKLLQLHSGTGRVEFSNKEIRLDSTLQLPDIKDNLEARLILLRRRLDERCNFLRLTRAGRGRFHLQIERRLALEEHP